MNFEVEMLVPVLEALAAVAVKLPYPHMAVAAAVLAGAAVVIRKLRAPKAEAPAVELRPAASQTAEDAKVIAIVSRALDKKKD